MARKRPNVLITLSDDQNPLAMGCANNPEIRTPAMDALASRGMRFTNAYHGGCTVHAVCCPARAQLFTGRQLFAIPNLLKGWWEEGCERYESPTAETADIPMLGQLLRANGYRCFGTGKWHNMQFSYIQNFNDGGAVYFCGGNEAQTALKKRPLLPSSPSGVTRPAELSQGGHFNKTLHEFDASGEYGPGNCYIEPRHTTEAFTQAVVDFIDNYDGDEPFFIYCPFTAPHGPCSTYQEWHDQYPADSISLPKNHREVVPWDNGGLFVKERLEQGWRITEQDCRQAIADHYAITAHMDDGIGRIHAALERNGYLDDTIVVHSGDHGKSEGHHGFKGKQTLYEHAAGVPLLVAGPGIPADTVNDNLVYQHDLYNTILEAADIKTQEPSYYQSLLPQLNEQPTEGREYIHSSYIGCQRMVRDRRYKLIEYAVEGVRRTELFDLIEDPDEIVDLSQDATRSKDLKRLRAELKRWQQQVQDPCITDFA
jgi:arylsulfatase A-like enzyme